MNLKITIRVCFFLLLCISSAVIKSTIPSAVVGTLYTVAGIMFSVGIGLIVSFNLQGIKNKKFISIIRKNLNKIRNRYIAFLSISTVVFVLFEYLPPAVVKFTFTNKNVSFNLSVFAGGIILYSIFYFVINFLSIQKLSNDVFDEANK